MRPTLNCSSLCTSRARTESSGASRCYSSVLEQRWGRSVCILSGSARKPLCHVVQLKPLRPCYFTLPPAPTLPPLFFLSHLFFPLLLPVCVQCPGSDFCPAPLGSLYVLSVSLSLQGTVPKAFAARKISLTSEYTTYTRGGGCTLHLMGDGENLSALQHNQWLWSPTVFSS